MDWFLDMCIILFYSEGERTNSLKAKKVIEFVKNKGQKRFVVCFYIIENDLPKYIERQRIVTRELQRKINNPNHAIGSLGEGLKLYPRDKNLAEKLYHLMKTAQKPQKFITKLNEIRTKVENRINFFIQTIINEKVIPINEIDFELRSSLFTYIQNISDSNILASGIQQHNKKELFLLTEDKKDWNKDNLEWTMSPQLLKKYPKVPEVKYLKDL